MNKYMDEVYPGIKPAQRYLEFQELLKVYREIDPCYVVEIGSWKGGTLWHWLHEASPGAHVISINLKPTEWMSPDPEFKSSIWRKWVPPGVHLHTITGDSKKPWIITKVGALCPRIDFLFLDGDHSYDGIKADWDNYSPMVRDGGVIAMHDLIPPKGRERIQVGKFFNELKKAGYRTREFYSEANQKDMGIGVVYYV